MKLRSCGSSSSIASIQASSFAVAPGSNITRSLRCWLELSAGVATAEPTSSSRDWISSSCARAAVSALGWMLQLHAQ